MIERPKQHKNGIKLVVRMLSMVRFDLSEREIMYATIESVFIKVSE